MRKIDVGWGGEIRDFLEERVKQYELMRALEEMGPRARARRVKIDSTKLIRDDRER